MEKFDLGVDFPISSPRFGLKMKTHRNLIKRGKIWYFRASINGKNYERSTRMEHLKAAKEIRDAWLSSLILGNGLKPKPKPVILDGIVRAYFSYKGEKPKWETRAHNVASMGKILESWGLTFACRISDVSDAMRWYRDNCENRPNSINTALRSAKALFTARMVEHYASKGLAVDGVEDIFKVSYLPATEPEGLPPIDIMRILDNFSLTFMPDEDLYKAWVLVRYCGLRNSEIVNLTVDSIKNNEDRWWVELKKTKTGKSRNVPISAERAKVLLADTENGFILSGPVTRRKNTVNRHLSKWLRAFIPSEYCKTVYAVRKYCESIFVQKYGLFAASKIMGHSKAISYSYYAELLEMPEPL